MFSSSLNVRYQPLAVPGIVELVNIVDLVIVCNTFRAGGGCLQPLSPLGEQQTHCSVAVLQTGAHMAWHAAGTQRMLGNAACLLILTFTEHTMIKPGGFQGSLSLPKEVVAGPSSRRAWDLSPGPLPCPDSPRSATSPHLRTEVGDAHCMGYCEARPAARVRVEFWVRPLNAWLLFLLSIHLSISIPLCLKEGS